MAYENMTYESILSRMLESVSAADPNVDTREGSMLYNALAPAAMELAIYYVSMGRTLDESFVGTASREYLYRKCEELGIDTSRFNATAGTFYGEFNVAVDIGSRWNCELYNYTVTEQLGDDGGVYLYKLTCETTGNAPNSVTGVLTPISYFPTGLTSANLTGVITEGKQPYSDDEIRAEYFAYLNSSINDGNLAQYKYWCDGYPGVGNYKITPLWNGANTVKVSILSESNKAADPTLVEEFQTYLDPNSEGMGNGVAPIGSFVTVSTAEEAEIIVSTTIKLAAGHNLEDAKTEIENALMKYFGTVAYVSNEVSQIEVGASILSCESVATVTSVLIAKRGDTLGASNITLGAEEIPVLADDSLVVNA